MMESMNPTADNRDESARDEDVEATEFQNSDPGTHDLDPADPATEEAAEQNSGEASPTPVFEDNETPAEHLSPHAGAEDDNPDENVETT